VFVDPTGELFGLPSPGDVIGDAWDETKDVASAAWNTTTSAASTAWNATTSAAEWASRQAGCLAQNIIGFVREHQRTISCTLLFAGVFLAPVAAAGESYEIYQAIRAGARLLRPYDTGIGS
jgi:hypothetical protein